MRIIPYEGKRPRLGKRVFLAPGSMLIGDVELGDDVSVWFNVVIRGDIHYVKIGAKSNVQDGTVIHVEHDDFPTVLEEEVSVGHGAILHGCTVRRGALIGMGAVVLNGAEVGESSLVAAGAVVKEGFKVPPKTLVAGVPARIIRELSEAEAERVAGTWRHYLEYKTRFLVELEEER